MMCMQEQNRIAHISSLFTVWLFKICTYLQLITLKEDHTVALLPPIFEMDSVK